MLDHSHGRPPILTPAANPLLAVYECAYNGSLRGFEWDPHKGRANVRRHGVEFADAVAVFEDERAVTVRDDLTAVDEQRWLTVGRDTRGGILVVAYTWRGDRIRVFSARRATASERRQYLEEAR